LEIPTRATVRLTGTPSPVGKIEQLLACKAGPDDYSDSVAIVAQWCFPLRLQHAGNFESAPNANTEGLISEKPKRASSSIADARRMEIILLRFERELVEQRNTLPCAPSTVRVAAFLACPSVARVSFKD